jgi:hypothetical protein
MASNISPDPPRGCDEFGCPESEMAFIGFVGLTASTAVE